MITNYKRARKDAEILVAWAGRLGAGDRHVEALAVMNTLDARAVILTALLHNGGHFPSLPDGGEQHGDDEHARAAG